MDNHSIIPAGQAVKPSERLDGGALVISIAISEQAANLWAILVTDLISSLSYCVKGDDGGGHGMVTLQKFCLTE